MRSEQSFCIFTTYEPIVKIWYNSYGTHYYWSISDRWLCSWLFFCFVFFVVIVFFLCAPLRLLAVELLHALTGLLSYCCAWWILSSLGITLLTFKWISNWAYLKYLHRHARANSLQANYKWVIWYWLPVLSPRAHDVLTPSQLRRCHVMTFICRINVNTTL